MTWFSKIENWFEKVLPNAAGWERIASATLTVSAPLLETVVTLTAGTPAEKMVADVVGQAQSDMAALSVLIAAAGPKPTILSILEAIKTSLAGLLTSADIKNSSKITEINSTVGLVISEVEAIIKAIG